MFEAAGDRQMVRPRLRALRKILVPAKIGHTHQRALSIVAFKEAIVETAEPRLCAGQHDDGCRQDGELDRLAAKAVHANSSNCEEWLTHPP